MGLRTARESPARGSSRLHGRVWLKCGPEQRDSCLGLRMAAAAAAVVVAAAVAVAAGGRRRWAGGRCAPAGCCRSSSRESGGHSGAPRD